MNVLSLFDGMSCGRVALERAGIKVNNYYSSEIDKYAIQIANKNYPQDEINRLGDVTTIKASDLPNIDLLIGGSPCQGFSFAGKQLNFEDERSKLFFEFVRLLKETKPKYFLLENVKMKKEYQNVITKYLNVEPILINSSLLSAQNRERLYWTNIPNIEHIEDKGILIKDILENEVSENYYLNKPLMLNGKKSGQIGILDYKDKGILIKDILEKDKDIDFIDNFKNCVRKNLIGIDVNNYLKYNGFSQIPSSSGFQDHKIGIVKTPCLRAGNSFTLIQTRKKGIRLATPLEWERLQTLPDNYTEGVSNSQRYKMLGNGWTVDVIAHIFRAFNEKKPNIK